VADDRRPGRLPRRDWLAWVGVGTALVTALGAMISVAVSYSGANEQTELTRQGQFTDRYSKAVEQLGTPGVSDVTVRLGGIYALQRLAHDSKDDKGTIIEVLAAFVRDPVGRPKSTPPRNVVSPLPPTDVAAALTVLDRLGGLHGVDLHGADLRRADLSSADLRRADLSGADLTGATLSRAILDGADLGGATLSRANLRNATLTGAYLYGANLTGAYLSDANLTRAYLSDTNLTDARLSFTDLTGANLWGADLTLAALGFANLTGANLSVANLTRANLFGATLTGATLTGADLTGANLKDAHLTGVKGFPSPAPTGVQPS
jgi:uncharacterized protein YjbI with pentapeptide repeats